MNDWRDDGQAAAELAREREHMVVLALMACLAKGVPERDVHILASELRIDERLLVGKAAA